jgi:hypothetical protein
LTAYADGDCSGGDCEAGADAHVQDAMPASDGTMVFDAPASDTADGSLTQDVVGADAVVDVTPGDVVSTEAGTCPASCATTCTTHSNGVGQSYDDCNPLYSSNNPWTETAAYEACTALTGDVAKCSLFKCNGTQSVCSSGISVCDCWEFSGAESGHVNATGNCDCVQATDPTWD